MTRLPVVIVLFLLMIFPLLLLTGCTPLVHPTVGAQLHPELAGLQAGQVRDHFTRTVVPPDLDVRWVEVTLIDPAWVAAEDREWGLLAQAGEEEVSRRTVERLAALGWGEAGTIAFEVWAFTQCTGCADLARWRWELAGPAGTQRSRFPETARAEVMSEEVQTLTLFGISRQITLSKARGELRFGGPAGPGQLVLLGTPPAPGFEPMRFVWQTTR